jgi:hypothetical protein
MRQTISGENRQVTLPTGFGEGWRGVGAAGEVEGAAGSERIRELDQERIGREIDVGRVGQWAFNRGANASGKRRVSFAVFRAGGPALREQVLLYFPMLRGAFRWG